MKNGSKLIIEDIRFDTLPAGTMSVKHPGVIAVTVLFVGIYLSDKLSK